jgi:hypothetical protein
MGRLDDYRMALLVAMPAASDSEFDRAIEVGGERFVSFVVDHGLGPVWHERTGREQFRESRMQAEALYLVQEKPLGEIGAVLDEAGVEHVVIKGAANRLFLYENPALRACYDLDVLVRPDDRVRAAELLVNVGFVPIPDPAGISRGIVLRRNDSEVDLHWGLLREGRLRDDPVSAMLKRRRRISGLWMLSAEDALFTLLVHPAFAKHLGGWDMGLHRVLDVIAWLRMKPVEWDLVGQRLGNCGVRTAAWATLCWVALLTAPNSPKELRAMLADLQPGRMRAAWIYRWLRSNLSERTSHVHWARLLGFSLFLHDTPADAFRALAGRRRARHRQEHDLSVFGELLRQ